MGSLGRPWHGNDFAFVVTDQMDEVDGMARVRPRSGSFLLGVLGVATPAAVSAWCRVDAAQALT